MSMKDFINSCLVNKSMSGKKILSKMNTNIVLYNNLGDYDTLSDLTGEKNNCVILYETNGKLVGHWVLLLYHPDRNTFEFFDSYGNTPDYILYNGIGFYKGENPHLSQMILAEKRPVEYNDYPLQKLSRDVATCGRWCYARYLFKSVDIDTFIDFFKEKQTFTPDQIVCLIMLQDL